MYHCDSQALGAGEWQVPVLSKVPLMGPATEASRPEAPGLESQRYLALPCWGYAPAGAVRQSLGGRWQFGVYR